MVAAVVVMDEAGGSEEDCQVSEVTLSCFCAHLPLGLGPSAWEVLEAGCGCCGHMRWEQVWGKWLLVLCGSPAL